MASALYPLAKQSLLSQSPSIDLDTDTIKVSLIDTALYTYSAAHQYYSSASVGVVGSPVTLASKTILLGVFDAGDVTFSGVTGATVEALIVWKDTGTEATSPLIAYIDTATGLPVSPNGGDILVTWDSGASRIFAL